MFQNFLIHHLISIKLVIIVLSNPIKVLDKGILPLETDSIAIQFYLDLENDDKFESCRLHSEANKCCLYDKNETDCDSMKVHGKHDCLLKPKDRKMLLFFYVTMFQLEREGYCNLDLAYHCGVTGSKNEDIKIPFDTRLHKRRRHNYLLKNYKHKRIAKCKSVDEDPLNDCRPVNCDLKYAGTRSFFDKNKQICLPTVKCLSDPLKNMPDIVYEPTSNTCKDLDHSLSVTDIYSINSGLGIIVTPPENANAVDDTNLVVYKPDYSSISQNVLFLRDIITGKLDDLKGTVNIKRSCNHAFMSIFTTIFGISVSIVLFVCFTNICLIIHKEWKKDRNMKQRSKKNDDFRDVPKGRTSKEVTNNLLKQVIVSEVPMEMRDSVVDICERIGKQVRWKKRYRMVDDESDIHLKTVASSETFTTSELDPSERERILK